METITLTVDTTVDENDGSDRDTGLSLRDAISIARETPENEYIIELEGDKTYSLDLNGTDAKGGDLDVSGNVTILAKGNKPAIIDASELTERDRVLDITQNSNVNLENLIITGGTAELNTTDDEGQSLGGGIRILEGSEVVISNSSISSNNALSAGGGIFIDTDSEVELIDSQVVSNQSGNGGGGIFQGSGDLTVRNSRIIDNEGNTDEIPGTGGGGILNFTGTIAVYDSYIAGNTAYQGGGGIHNTALAFPENAAVIIENSEISNNTVVEGLGGGIANGDEIRSGGILDVKDSLISNNVATNTTSAQGGGISTSSGRVNIETTTIDSNSATWKGGGILIRGGDVNLVSSTVSNNSAVGLSGGGIAINDVLSPVVGVENSTISGNTADTGGGGISVDAFTSSEGVLADIRNSTITNNTANTGAGSFDGGGIYNRLDDAVSLENSIVLGNFNADEDTPSDISGSVFLLSGETGSKSVIGDNNNLIGTLDNVEGTIGTGSDIVDADVSLTPLQDNGGATLTHALTEDSLAINAGANSNLPVDLLDLDDDNNTTEKIPRDQVGNRRILDDTVDIGAVEFDPSAPNDSRSPTDTNNDKPEDNNTDEIDDTVDLTDKPEVENAKGSKNNDLLIGNELDNELKGEGGNDRLIAGEGDDTLLGGSGNDTLTGSNPQEFESGKREYDILTGGKGADTFVLGDSSEMYYKDNGFVTITDFNYVERDVILASGTASQYSFEDAPDGVYLMYEEDRIAYILGSTELSTLLDFTFV